MTRRAWSASFLISLFLCLAATACAPTWILDIRTAEGGALVFCSRVTGQDEILYTSINSIYNDPVEEYWQVQADGRLKVVRVITSPAVMGYYGIASFSPVEGSRMRASPPDLTYDEIRMLVDALGQQQLTVQGHMVDLYHLLPEATILVIRARTAPMGFGC